MVKKIYIASMLALIAVSANNTLQARIIETDTINEILHHLDADTIVIFDIDNTIGAPEKELGSDEWFSHSMQKHLQQGDDMPTIKKQLLPLFFALQHTLLLQPIESETPAFIEQLQKNNIPTIALTVRSLPIANRTIEQLAHMAINFSKTAPHQPTCTIKIDDHNGIYKHGIIFCNGHHSKGKALRHFFAQANYYPRKIIFIDDKLKYLTDVEQVATELGIEFIGLRYNRCDHKVAAFNNAAAEEQLTHFLQHHGHTITSLDYAAI